MSEWPILDLFYWLGVVAALLAVGYFGGFWIGRRPDRGDNAELRREAEILKLVVEHAHEGLLIQNVNGQIEWSNPSYSRITGYSAEEVLGRRPQEYILTPNNQLSPEEIENFQYDLTKIKTGGNELILNRRANGEYFWNELTFAVVEADRKENTKIILICRDVTNQVEHLKELEEAQNRLKHQAEHDDLTGVANRSKLSSFLQEQVTASMGSSSQIGLVHFDLDHFKDVNDAHGHSAGDAVLRHAADALMSVLGDKGVVARIGGDEFLAVLPEPESAEHMEALGAQILAGLAKPVKVDGHRLRVGGSVGLVLADGSKLSASELINRADMALYAAKRSGRSQITWYTDTLGAAHRYRRMSLAQLDQDLETGDLRLLMQPMYCANRRQIVGYEVTPRWLHPSEGLVDPVKLLSSKEDVKRIAEIERFALQRGLVEVKRLRESSNIPFFVSVNLTGASLNDRGFCEAIKTMSDDVEFSRNDIHIELDEKIIRFDETDGLSQAMDEINRLGCQISLDHFGGGHGGAGLLLHVEAEGLKISPGLIAGIETGENERKLVQSILRLAGEFGLEASAAGVDRPEQVKILKELGCSVIQGKAVSGLLTPREAEAHMREFELETQ
jgi:diguanylate cyclase (GGDEF)-like protein/PAS domain S-box-containing protein